MEALIWHCLLIGDRGEQGLPGEPPKMIPSMLLEMKGEKGNEGLEGAKGSIGLQGKELCP